MRLNGQTVAIPVSQRSIDVTVGPFDPSGCSAFALSPLLEVGSPQIFTVAYADAYGNPQVKSASIILSIEMRRVFDNGEIASFTTLASPSDVLASVAENENFMASMTRSGRYLIEINRRDLAVAQARGATVGSIFISAGAPSFQSSATGSGLLAVKFGNSGNLV